MGRLFCLVNGASCGTGPGAPPLSQAGEGWGEGASALGLSEACSDNPLEERAPTRRFAPTSPASGRGCTEPADAPVALRRLP
ncbi:hypothetical protein ABIA45_006456 [Bradyrhizobium sp. USDA 336]